MEWWQLVLIGLACGAVGIVGTILVIFKDFRIL